MLSNGVAFAMYFGIFGSIFFLAQYFQGPLGYSPLEAGIRTLPWTAAPMIVVPLTTAVVDRVGGGILQAVGLLLQALSLAWIALIAATGLSYWEILPSMIMAGIGMGIVFAANPATFIGAVRESDHNKASGVNNTVREFGGALGVAVLTTIFTHAYLAHTADGSSEAFVSGLRPALWVGAVVCLAGAALGLFIRRAPAEATESAAAPEPVMTEMS
jgi:hypothetical protein